MNKENKIKKLESQLNLAMLDIEDARRLLGSVGHEGLLLTCLRINEEKDKALQLAKAWETIAIRESQIS